ncbi:hypothetical protein CsatB_017196 [Cannabis sativa]|uniref:uncharacterized protein LOC133036042 n=1 Tax=Cannabis sativa TaxID=3483 RepID=UPI0029C9C136|nr:uncharacterized protein LOC133036042 [Cannabis sativa]
MLHGGGAIAWDRVCQPKAEGGLGIKKLEEWNKEAMSNLFTAPQPRVKWCKEVWARLNTPKHSVILWLAMLNRLKTKERLKKYGILLQDHCSLCDSNMENEQHLFFDCCLSSYCLDEIKHWLDWKAINMSLPQLVRWIGTARVSKFKKLVLAAAIAAVVYRICQERNGVIWHGNKVNKCQMVEDIKWSLRTRINMVFPKKIQSIDRDWFYAL